MWSGAQDNSMESCQFLLVSKTSLSSGRVDVWKPFGRRSLRYGSIVFMRYFWVWQRADRHECGELLALWGRTLNWHQNDPQRCRVGPSLVVSYSSQKLFGNVSIFRLLTSNMHHICAGRNQLWWVEHQVFRNCWVRPHSTYTIYGFCVTLEFMETIIWWRQVIIFWENCDTKVISQTQHRCFIAWKPKYETCRIHCQAQRTSVEYFAHSAHFQQGQFYLVSCWVSNRYKFQLIDRWTRLQ